MKAFLVLLVLTAGGLVGVFYFRRWVQTPHAPVVAAASDPVKPTKERRPRHRRGARRLPRNALATSPTQGAVAMGEVPSREAPRPSAPREDPAPMPGGSSISESPPEDVFGSSEPSPLPLPSAGGDRAAPVDERPAVKLRPADVKMVWQGEDLSRAETMRLDLSNNGHELTDDEIDARFRTKEDAVLACIARARPTEDTFVPGHVTVKFRIRSTGAVKGVQVEAPVILHKGGLTGCIRNVMGSLRFPPSNMGQVVSFPFSLT